MRHYLGVSCEEDPPQRGSPLLHHSFLSSPALLFTFLIDSFSLHLSSSIASFTRCFFSALLSGLLFIILCSLSSFTSIHPAVVLPQHLFLSFFLNFLSFFISGFSSPPPSLVFPGHICGGTHSFLVVFCRTVQAVLFSRVHKAPFPI